MILLDIKGNIVSSVHKVCISNETKDKFLSITTTGLRWIDNFNLASCFDDIQEAFEFTDKPYTQEFIGDECEQYIWTNTRKSVFEDN